MIQANQYRSLGTSGIAVSPLGVGTNRWVFGQNDESVLQAFVASREAGVNFFDTAEIYGNGKSERLLGACLQRDQRNAVVVASKFSPWPTRLSGRQFMNALDASLSRLGIPAIDLYYIHWPFTWLRVETLMDWMAQAVEAGKVRAVGVSNFSATQMRRAADRLARYHITLAANEVHYSLLNRKPEVNGVLDACRDLQVALVAYRPMESGRLTQNNTAGPRTETATTTLHEALLEVARHHGASTGQVALNWLLRRDSCVIPIPGATSARHATENAAALAWELNDEEFTAIDQASSPFAA